jgi:hypothetical protein
VGEGEATEDRFNLRAVVPETLPKVRVWVKLRCEAIVGVFDLLLVRVPPDAEHFVVVQSVEPVVELAHDPLSLRGEVEGLSAERLCFNELH